jgi:hypothetical protein
MSTSLSWPANYKPFTDYSLQRAIDRAVANLPKDHTTAIVAHVDNEEGASLSAVVRVNDEWKLSATLVKGWDKPFKYGAEVVWSK